MEKILVSACLLGTRVRYDGGDCGAMGGERLRQWLEEGRVVPICPEVVGGLPVPRPRCEIRGVGGGLAVLAGNAYIETENGGDATAEYVRGAEKALELAEQHGIKIAVLKADSPSCGNKQIYDGSHTGKKVPGMGVTAALLAQHGVKVFSERELNEVESFLCAKL